MKHTDDQDPPDDEKNPNPFSPSGTFRDTQGEQVAMKTRQHEKNGMEFPDIPDTSFTETDFGRIKKDSIPDIERRLAALRNPHTGMVPPDKAEPFFCI